MDKETRAGVLKTISNVQTDTSSVTVQIGGVSDNTGIVEHDTLYIKNAPARLIDELQGMGYSLSVTDDGVKIRE